MARNHSIEIMKFIATLAIFNHLAQSFYGKWAVLATGGSIGCSIFFFCSGFTLAMGNLNDKFDNWYKRRLARLWPSCIAASLLYCIVGQEYRGSVLFALTGAGWFVSCILTYYAVFYWSNKMSGNRIGIEIVTVVVVVFVWWWGLFVQRSPVVTSIYGGSYFRWGFYYLFFLMGVAVAKRRICEDDKTRSAKNKFFLCIGCILMYYAIIFVFKGEKILSQYQVLSLLPLIGIVYFLYIALESLPRIVKSKMNFVVTMIGGLSLEMYLVGRYGAGFAPLGWGPVSYGIGLIMALSMAYLVRMFGRFFAQTISTNKAYDWKALFAL